MIVKHLSPVITLIFLLLSFPIFAQETTPEEDSLKVWQFAGSASLSFSNVGLSNWAGGGENSISVGSILDGKVSRVTDKSTWKTNLNVAYGVARVGGSESIFKKTDDQIILNTDYSYKFNPKWSLSASSEWRTQLAPGYTYAVNAEGREVEDQRISNLFAPAYAVQAIGVQYQNKFLTATISPYASKFTFVLDDSLSAAGAFGVEPGERVRAEWGGFNFNLKLEFEPFENAVFKSNFNAFANYETPDLIDVNWETLLVLKVNKFINTSFSTQLIYDHDVLIPQDDGSLRQATQFKHVLNINVGVKF